MMNDAINRLHSKTSDIVNEDLISGRDLIYCYLENDNRSLLKLKKILNIINYEIFEYNVKEDDSITIRESIFQKSIDMKNRFYIIHIENKKDIINSISNIMNVTMLLNENNIELLKNRYGDLKSITHSDLYSAIINNFEYELGKDLLSFNDDEIDLLIMKIAI